jgi:hypothetical protein
LPCRRHHLGTAGPPASRRCRSWCFFFGKISTKMIYTIQTYCAMWCPQDISWFISPSNYIVINTINHR